MLQEIADLVSEVVIDMESVVSGSEVETDCSKAVVRPTRGWYVITRQGSKIKTHFSAPLFVGTKECRCTGRFYRTPVMPVLPVMPDMPDKLGTYQYPIDKYRYHQEALLLCALPHTFPPSPCSSASSAASPSTLAACSGVRARGPSLTSFSLSSHTCTGC